MMKYYCANIKLLENQKLFDALFEEMNIQRRTKILRCKNLLDKRRSLLAGILLKYGLEKEGISYETTEFTQNENGKPLVSNILNLYFSISHADEHVGCLFGDVSVGMDIESLDKSLFKEGKEIRLEATARKCLSPAEWEVFSESDDKKRIFLEFWTKKESYSKALGKGLKMNFSQINTIEMDGKFWSHWTADNYCISMYREDGNYEDICIEKLKQIPFPL